MKTTIISFFGRDLNKLREEISSYKDESSLWIVRGEVSNSAGNLALHIIGNLKHFIGATLGNTGYARQRDLEFSTKNVPREELLKAIEETIYIVEETLIAIPEEDYEKNFPLEKHGEVISIGHMLLHLLTHLNYHLGQVNYHRRLIES